MIDWVDVLRRLMMLYNVKTQAELSMAMGVAVQVGIGSDIQKTGIPWMILERAVQDKHVSWNWLLAGKETMWGGEGKPDSPPRSAGRGDEDTEWRERPRNNPRIETRELTRRLLYKNKTTDSMHDKPEKAATGQSSDIQTLEEFKVAMEKEAERVDRELNKVK